MAVLAPYVTPEILRAALSPATFSALFDDEQSGDLDAVDASLAVQLCLKRGHARVMARLPVIYTVLPPSDVPDNIPALLQDAEICYCEALAYNRHAEYVKAYGAPKFEEADEIMERVQTGMLKIADNPPEPEPANIGGIVTDSGQRAFLGVTNGRMNSGDF